MLDYQVSVRGRNRTQGRRCGEGPGRGYIEEGAIERAAETMANKTDWWVSSGSLVIDSSTSIITNRRPSFSSDDSQKVGTDRECSMSCSFYFGEMWRAKKNNVGGPNDLISAST